MKYFDFKRYKFSTVTKTFNTLVKKFLKISQPIYYKLYSFKKIYRYLNFNNLNFTKITKYFNFRGFNLTKITRYFNFISYITNLKRNNFLRSRFLLFHLPASIVFFAFLYIVIPSFYNYDKFEVAKNICKNIKIECLIKGKISYAFYPTPRLKVKDLLINELDGKKRILLSAQDLSIKISFKNLLIKNKHQFTRIKVNNFKINFYLKNLKNLKNIYKNNFIPTVFKNGQVMLYKNNDYIGSIASANIYTKFANGFAKSKLEGKFLNDNILINLNAEKKDTNELVELVFKMSNLGLLAKIGFIKPLQDESFSNGNFTIKKDKNKIVGIFGYKDNKLVIKKSNIRNSFIDGKLDGVITFIPYFDFNLDLNLNNINFTKLYNYFLSLDSKEQKELFRINKKINGKFNFSVNKVYSKHNVVKSLESRIKLYNGNINIEQFLVNLGKLGAADVIGAINSDNKSTNLKFESNIFIDNKKKFFSKFGIYDYDKEKAPSSLFVSGNFDLKNIKTSFYEISAVNKLNAEDIDYIENGFNDFMLEDEFKYLFDFPKLKVFLKSILNK